MNGSIRKRGEKSWELTIGLGRDANGRRLRKFVNVKGTKKLAQEKLRELLTNLDKGIPLSPGKITPGGMAGEVAGGVCDSQLPAENQGTVRGDYPAAHHPRVGAYRAEKAHPQRRSGF